ncbi:MAG: CRISPR-associated endonuclease Cas2 [Phycisphaerae bacterium]
MPSARRNLSEYKGMWLFVLFDLPVDTRSRRRKYARFRKELRKEGFSMLQFSVYARYFPSEEASIARQKRIRESLPPEGHVRLLTVTDKQFGKMKVFFGKVEYEPEKEPEQLLLF